MNLLKRQRKSTILVQARYRGKRSFPIKADHISMDSMFLPTRTLSMPINTDIELQFSINNRAFKISAIVTDDCSDGIYVGFYELQPEAYDAFQKWKQIKNSTKQSAPLHLPSAA